MDQKKFIEELYKTRKFKTKKETREFVDIFLETLKQGIEQEKKVQFTNFGSFKLIKSEKSVYVPSKKEKIKKESLDIRFKASNNIRFKASNNIKEIIKENTEENKIRRK